MAGTGHPSMSFIALNSLLRSANIPPGEAKKVLDDHKDELFRAARVSKDGKALLEGSSDIKYRVGAATTKSHPKPTAAELICIESVQKGIGITKAEAAVLLRDYLQELKGYGAADMLDNSADFMDVAPVDALVDFRNRERRSAFSCLVTLFAGASQRSTHTYYDMFSSFLSENRDTLKEIVLQGTTAALASYGEKAKGRSTGGISDVEGWWIMELLFAFCLYEVLSPLAKDKLLREYSALVKQSPSARRSTNEERIYRTTCLDGAEATALFAAALNLPNGLVSAVHLESEAMDLESSEREHSDRRTALAKDVHMVRRIDEVFTAMKGCQTAEAVIMSFSWASFLRLRQWLRNLGSAEDPDIQFDAVGHMSSAIESNVFGALRTVAAADLNVDELIIGELYHCFWVDIVAFLTAFPPQNLSSAQVEEVVDLSTRLLRRTDHDTCVETAESLWERENTEAENTGANTLLRLASAVYPQTFRPLILLLTSLTLSQNSAARAADHLENGLITLTEYCDTYQDSLLVLDEEEDSQIWQSVKLGNGAELERIFRNLSAVSPGGEDVVYVQAGKDLLPDSYRPRISRGSLGICNSSLTVVTWIIAWDGFGAIDHILRVVLRLLREHEASFVYHEVVLTELLSSALDCLKFIDRLCRTGSKALRQSIVHGEERISVVSGIVAELADPGDWARGSWLTKKRREVLLTASASCIASLTIGSANQARRALERIGSSKNALPLQAALSSLGANAFPAVAAISRVASVCSDGENLSDDFVNKLSVLSRSSETPLASEAFEGGRGGANRVYKFLRAVALPLWLTTSMMEDAGPETKSLHWLLPACSLQLFSKRPKDVLSDPAISSVLISVITGAAVIGRDSYREKDATNTFLFPALRAALLACYEALRERNSYLQDMRRQDASRRSQREVHSSGNLDTGADLTALEKLLLKPDVIQAMAVMSSGGCERLKRKNFFSVWAESEFSCFLPEVDSTRYLFLNASRKDVLAETVCSWRVWIEDMCARCLSLQFCCLSQLSENIIQVPWPTMDRSAFGYWRGGGEWIRKGYAERIRGGSIAATELIVTVLSCGQRAAARSLMAPRPKRSGSADTVSRHDNSNGSSSDHKTNETRAATVGSQSIPNVRRSPDEASETRSEILSSVVMCLCENRDSWVDKITEADSTEDKDKTVLFKVLGQIALTIAACVRFLRVGWESHSSKWFQECWKEPKVWELLASLLQCDGGKGAGKVDLAKAIDSQHDSLWIDVAEGFTKMLATVGIESILLKQSLSVDIVTAWKAIASDCLQVFSSEILLRASEALVLPSAGPNSATERTDHKEKKVSADVFKGEPFVQFAAVFTERWMQVLLRVDEHYLCGTSVMILNKNNTHRKHISANARRNDQFISVEQRARRLSVLLGTAIGLSERQAEQSRILYDFRRAGDVRIRFGADYAFDVPAILSFMRALDVDIAPYESLLIEILRLNAELSRKDVQVELVTAFSGMASAVLFADSFAPSQPVALTYSSPQFAGKLCRFLSRVLVCIVPSISSSAHTFTIVGEVAKLLASLSAKLSPDELEQTALTSIRFADPPPFAQQECSLSPLGQICFSIKHIITSIQARSNEKGVDTDRLDSVRWLLLTASNLASGPSFRNLHDIGELANSAILALLSGKATPSLYAAASVAMLAVLENGKELALAFMFDERVIEGIFTSIAALARTSTEKPHESRACESAASLLLAVARMQLVSGEGSVTAQSCILKHLSGGSVLAFLPQSGETISTYEANLEARNPAHLVWCACLQLSGVIIPGEATHTRSSFSREQGLRDVLEFCSTNLVRIARDSLDLSGDWPASGGEPDTHVHDRAQAPKHLTIGRVEEAEVACVTVFKLSSYALQLQEALPELLHMTISELIRFTYQVYRLIRAEPVERWVRPVTQRERDRSQLLRNDRENTLANAAFGYSPSPWTMSPSKSSAGGPGTSPRRSPSQALRAAIGGSGGRGSRLSPGIFPPSPGMPATPLQTPLTGNQGPHATLFCSPGSPWGPYGSGLITSAGLHFGEEASRSLLRGLCFALGALRRFSDVMDALLFQPTMILSEESLGLGVLVAIQYHACNEVCRGAEGERRDSLQMIIDNALHLTMTHVLTFNDQGLLTQGVKDELRKRIGTVRLRMQKVVPPAPPFSIIHSREFEAFLHQLKGSV